MKTAKEHAAETAKLNGFYHYYFDNGNINASFFYKNGEQNGPYRLYYRSGKLRTISQSLHYRPYNLLTNFTEDGVIESTIVFIV